MKDIGYFLKGLFIVVTFPIWAPVYVAIFFIVVFCEFCHDLGHYF